MISEAAGGRCPPFFFVRVPRKGLRSYEVFLETDAKLTRLDEACRGLCISGSCTLCLKSAYLSGLVRLLQQHWRSAWLGPCLSDFEMVLNGSLAM